MLNQILLAAFFLAMVSGFAHAGEPKKPGMIILEESFESEKLNIRMTNDLKGTIKGRICGHCEEMTVTITPETKAFENRKPVPLIEAKKRYGKPALVVFDVKTKIVNRIRW